MSPISPNEFQKIAERMRANEIALEHCPSHEFTLHYLSGEANPPRWVCERCHGIIDDTTYQWYARGWRDATNQHQQNPPDPQQNPQP